MTYKPPKRAPINYGSCPRCAKPLIEGSVWGHLELCGVIISKYVGDDTIISCLCGTVICTRISMINTGEMMQHFKLRHDWEKILVTLVLSEM